MKEGLSEQYRACLSNPTKRWELLKAFICDKDMRLGCAIARAVGSGCRKDFEVDAYFIELGPQL